MNRTVACATLGLLLAGTMAIAEIGPGLYEVPLWSEDYGEIGVVSMWNSSKTFSVEVVLDKGWTISRLQLYVGTDPVPTRDGSPDLGLFPYREWFSWREQPGQWGRELDLREELEFTWGAHSEPILNVAVHGTFFNMGGLNLNVTDAWAQGTECIGDTTDTWFTPFPPCHPRRGQFIDSPVQGLSYRGPTQEGTTGSDADNEDGGFLFFPGESIDFTIGSVPLGTALAARKVSPLDLFPGSDTEDPRVIGVARVLQTLDSDSGAARQDGKIVLLPEVVECLDKVLTILRVDAIDYGDALLVEKVVTLVPAICNGEAGAELSKVSADQAKANLEAGLNASGIFRKNVSKSEDWGDTKQKLDVMPVYFPATISNGDPACCESGLDPDTDEPICIVEGVAYEEWRLGGDPLAEECDPRLFEDPTACVLTLIECRELAKPVLSAYLEKVDIHDEHSHTEFYPDRFSHDVVTAISRDDGNTWKRMNVSRMADLSSFDLETGEPFPGTTRSPQLKVNDNLILATWTSTFCKSGNPRYAINRCDDPETPEVETPETGCAVYCRGNPDEGTEVCEPDYPYDDDYFVTDIWGVRGHQRSVDYDEVDDVAELGIGEIPYSCLWTARGAIVTAKDLAEGTFASLILEDDPATEEDESRVLEVGDVVWYKPERLTSGRRDAFIPVVGSARRAGFAIAWQEDPEGLRPGKGKGPGQGWSGAISNHKTDIWYSFLAYDDFLNIDENFEPGGPPEDGGPDEKPGLGRPKALVPFSLPVRITDNDMVNTDTLKVELDGDGMPVIQDGTYTPVDPLTVEHGNAVGTKRYAYLARSIDDDADGVPDYQYYEDRGGTLDLCDLSGANLVLTELPGTAARERWYRFTNTEGSEKTVCVSSDGRLIDGDVSASRANISLQGYTKPDGTKSAWVLLAYEESKGMGHAPDHEETVDGGDGEGGVEKPIKQDFGKNVMYHSFDFAQPDLVAPGHVINLPALCGGLYPTYCDDTTNPTCTCEPGLPIPLYFETEAADGTWVPDTDKFLQYRTEIARRTRFIVQSPSKMGETNTLGVIIYKQGQEGQGRPADVFIRRLIKSGQGNPYRFDNFECNAYLDESFDLPGCPADGVKGHNCNVWGEAYGDRLCGGQYVDPNGGYMRRDHINLTSADIDFSVDAGPDDDTPDDPTDDIYGTDKVLLWSQHDFNLGDESYGHYTDEDNAESLAGMFSNARSHRGFVRGDFLVTAYAFSPNWAAGRNGNDRYNFYIRKSFDGGQTWTTTPAAEGGEGIFYCREWRSDPNNPDDDGSGNAPPVFDGFDPDCDPCAIVDEFGNCTPTESAEFYSPGVFQPAQNVSEIANNKETSSDPRVGATPPVPPLDATDPALPVLRFVEDIYVNNVFFVAWGTGDNAKSTGGTAVTPEAPPLDAYYTRSTNYGDTFLKVPWLVNGDGGNFTGEVVWRYERLAWGEEEQGECQLRATPDGSKMYGIYHQMTPIEGDEDEPITRWYPWEPEESHDNDIWFRRVIFWDDLLP